MSFSVEYYELENGNCPVEDFILEQNNKNYSENVESCEIIDIDQDNEDEENLQYIDNDEPADEYVNITQLPNKLILIYEKAIYAYSIDGNIMKLISLHFSCLNNADCHGMNVSRITIPSALTKV